MSLTRLYVGTYIRAKSFIKDREAASGIEYALIAAMVAVAIIAFVPTINAKITTMFTTIQNAL
ncbi:Flp family type IVb pilin [Pseudomonas syringae]|uniref:Pilus assembly protein n=1 Tax=Pseudomonas syringae pv. actinidiae TaxID=103796 RepID=A0A7Z6XXG9_PSESF|nr:Flp family type IVb pilin [Pseudomonas syringae]RMP79404.1 Pilus assembly protein [Pseudomonas syringae pv. actinidiae]